MKKHDRTVLKLELRRLWRSMDFVLRHPALNDEDNRENPRFAELNQAPIPGSEIWAAPQRVSFRAAGEGPEAIPDFARIRQG